jgi:glycosyltransferase involved in cell wall biosynthesis
MPRSSGIKRFLARFGFITYGERQIKKLDRLSIMGFKIIRTGFSENRYELLAAADILVCPSTLPHFSRPTIEAALVGTVVIGSNVEGILELVENEKSGLLFKAGSSAQLKDCLLKVLSNAELRINLSTAAQRNISANQDPKTHLQRLLKIYQAYLIKTERSELHF